MAPFFNGGEPFLRKLSWCSVKWVLLLHWLHIHCYSDVSYECQLLFTFCTSSELVVLRAHEAVTITDPQVHFPIFRKYYSWYIKPEGRGKTSGNLRNSGAYNSPLYIAYKWIHQAAIPEFTNVKHSQDRARYVCTAWRTLWTGATNITSLLQGCAIFGGLTRGSLVVLESTFLELWKCRIGKQEEQSHTSQSHAVRSLVQ